MPPETSMNYGDADGSFVSLKTDMWWQNGIFELYGASQNWPDWIIRDAGSHRPCPPGICALAFPPLRLELSLKAAER
jgi:hypothetical protein